MNDIQKRPDVVDLARAIARHIVHDVGMSDPKDVQRYLRYDNLETEVQAYVRYLNGTGE